MWVEISGKVKLLRAEVSYCRNISFPFCSTLRECGSRWYPACRMNTEPCDECALSVKMRASEALSVQLLILCWRSFSRLQGEPKLHLALVLGYRSESHSECTVLTAVSLPHKSRVPPKVFCELGFTISIILAPRLTAHPVVLPACFLETCLKLEERLCTAQYSVWVIVRASASWYWFSQSPK
jgi:hypothetical protein